MHAQYLGTAVGVSVGLVVALVAIAALIIIVIMVYTRYGYCCMSIEPYCWLYRYHIRSKQKYPTDIEQVSEYALILGGKYLMGYGSYLFNCGGVTT